MMAVYAVDDFGRDPHLVAALSPLARLRWNVKVTGAGNIPGSAALLEVSGYIERKTMTEGDAPRRSTKK